MRWRIPLIALFVLFAAVSCDQQPVAPLSEIETPEAGDLAENPLFSGHTGVVHHASLGGADVCEALGLPTGCDANFSLVANMRADGTVSGQWNDQFGGGVGVHVAVDCLYIVGNQAVVGGVVTQASGGIGSRALTTVFDNGTSKNDAPDEMSFSFWGLPPFIDCQFFDPGIFRDIGAVFELTNGQVKVW